MIEVTLGYPENNETNCFGEDHDVRWERTYVAIDTSETPPNIYEGKLYYHPPEDTDGSAKIDVDYVEQETLQIELSAKELFQLFCDDDQAAQLVRSALPTIIAIRIARRIN